MAHGLVIVRTRPFHRAPDFCALWWSHLCFVATVSVHKLWRWLPVQVIQHASKPNEDTYQWTLVNRSSCKKGCQGPILRAIQRYGRLGRCCSRSLVLPAETFRYLTFTAQLLRPFGQFKRTENLSLRD